MASSAWRALSQIGCGLLLRRDPREDAVEMGVLDDNAGIEVRVLLGVEPGGRSRSPSPGGRRSSAAPGQDAARLRESSDRAAAPYRSRAIRRTPLQLAPPDRGRAELQPWIKRSNPVSYAVTDRDCG